MNAVLLDSTAHLFSDQFNHRTTTFAVWENFNITIPKKNEIGKSSSVNLQAQ